MSPCEVTWDDLVAFGADYAFDLPAQAPASGVFVKTISGCVDTHAASPRNCDGTRVAYTIDIYIDSANLADYGVSNFTAASPTISCGT